MDSLHRGFLTTLCLAAIALGAPALAIGEQALTALRGGATAGSAGLQILGGDLLPSGEGSAAGGDSLLADNGEVNDSATLSPAADHVGGLPGLDGLNASSRAVREALEDLDPVTVRLLLGQVDRAILEHIAGSLAAPLPGIDEQGTTALPGLDGLPVRPRRQ
ncbi:hypothetical protein PC39_09575 [Salinisphaera sp. PC39]|uniref:hypothetical protein n=1 Tax=Salinisphaera sp. PC39 TaxID=1304156 RepID=UPI0033417871